MVRCSNKKHQLTTKDFTPFPVEKLRQINVHHVPVARSDIKGKGIKGSSPLLALEEKIWLGSYPCFTVIVLPLYNPHSKQ